MDPDHGVAHLVQPHSGRRARPQRATLRAAAAAVQITGRASRSSSICWCQRCAPPSRLACCAKAQGCCWLLMPLPPPSCARCCRPCTGAASTRFGGAGAEGPRFRPAVEGKGRGWGAGCQERTHGASSKAPGSNPISAGSCRRGQPAPSPEKTNPAEAGFGVSGLQGDRDHAVRICFLRAEKPTPAKASATRPRLAGSGIVPPPMFRTTTSLGRR